MSNFYLYKETQMLLPPKCEIIFTMIYFTIVWKGFIIQYKYNRLIKEEGTYSVQICNRQNVQIKSQDPRVIEDITEKRRGTLFGQSNLTSDSKKRAYPGL